MSKYRTLIVAIALFLVFDLGVLILNFYVSAAISKDAASVNLAGRQRMLSQRMVKGLLETQIAMQKGEDLAKPLDELKKSFTLFDDTFNAFSQGGQTMSGNGEPIQIDAVQDQAAIEVINKAFTLWQTFRAQLNNVLEPANPLSAITLNNAVDYGRANNVELLGLMNQLTSALEKVAAAKADRLRMIQIIGISLALLNFIIIIRHFIRHLRMSDAKAEAARQENQDILDSVSEGLFLLDQNGVIGAGHSKSIEEIFKTTQLTGSRLLEVLKPLVSEKVLWEYKDFLDILFRDHVNLKLIESLNPLRQVELFFKDSGIKKHLAFQFSRVDDKHRAVSHVLVTVKDLTQQVALALQLEKSEQKVEEQMTFLLGLLHLDPESAKEFIVATEQTLRQVNETLKQYGKNELALPKQCRLALLDILPMVHRAKGEAGLLGFSLFEEKLHALEDVIDELRKRPQVQGEDLLSLTVQLDRLMLDVKSIYGLLEHMSDLRQTFANDDAADFAPASSSSNLSFNHHTDNVTDENNVVTALRQMVQSMATTQGKRIEFFAEGFEALLLTSHQRNQLRDILLQLMRNAVTHGIELPDERLASGKAEIGQIRLQAQIQAQGCSIICYDDGRGIDASRLRDAALIGGYANEDDLFDCDEQNLYALMFETGLSTAEEVTVHAGRGVGLDVVKQQIKTLGGQLALATELGQFCAWRISLPYTHLEHLPFAAL